MASGWRLLQDGSGDGPWNMGVDEALLASASDDGVASLRLYTWSGPWLSLGYAQRLEPERRRACADAGVGVVSRVTGGRAVLHGCDLTYAVAARNDRFPSGLRGAYEEVAAALLQALARLGVDATRSAPGAKAPAGADFDCFAVPAADEICVAGRKLAGSAQRRLTGAFLQHGSLRLRPDPGTAARAAGAPGPGATSLAEIGVGSDEEAVRRACVEAFGDVLGVVFETGSLTSAERASASARTLSAPLRGGRPSPADAPLP